MAARIAEACSENAARAKATPGLDVRGGWAGLSARTREGGCDARPVFGGEIAQTLFEGIGSSAVQRRLFQLQRRFDRTQTQNDAR